MIEALGYFITAPEERNSCRKSFKLYEPQRGEIWSIIRISKDIFSNH
jgi:hypothetical protein